MRTSDAEASKCAARNQRRHGRLWKVPQAFRGERIAIRPLTTDGQWGVFFAAYRIATIDLTSKESVGHVSEQVSVMSPD